MQFHNFDHSFKKGKPQINQKYKRLKLHITLGFVLYQLRSPLNLR